jgi:hypothetical protein
MDARYKIAEAMMRGVGQPMAAFPDQRQDDDMALRGMASDLYQADNRRAQDYRAGIKEAILQSWPAELAKDAWGVIKTPREAYDGKFDPLSDEGIKRAANFAGLMTLGAGGVPAGRNEMRMGIKAYHASPHDFDQFKPSEFRGASFFSPTEKGARSGATAGVDEMIMDTATKLPERRMRMYEVDIEPSKIKGLAFTPDEISKFNSLPVRASEAEIGRMRAKGTLPGGDWELSYTANKMPDGKYLYVRRNEPPAMSYEDAVKGGRDIYGQQWPHYAGSQTNEKGSAQRVLKDGMGGWLVHDEGGLSVAVANPSLISILRKYGVATAAALPAAALAELGMSREEAKRLF